MERYEYMVKNFDQQLLNQLKLRDFILQGIEIADDEKKDDNFHKRIAKIETEGLSRNRMYYEFVDTKNEFNEAKTSFYSEIALALKDELIIEIGELSILVFYNSNLLLLFV